jgi:Uma2 family endonuclease
MTIAFAKPTQTATDQLIIVKGDWAKYKLIRQGCDDSSSIRVAYFDGIIEIIMPARPHEIFSDLFHALLSFYLFQLGIEFVGTGSADQEAEGIAAAQPDRSYCIGGIKPIPDLSIEIIFSSGSIKKLERYRAIGVPEVWFWEDGVLALYHLRSNGYEQIEQSELPGLKDLDLAIFKRCLLVGETSTTEAMRELNTYLQSQGE